MKNLDLTTSLPRTERSKGREKWIRLPFMRKVSTDSQKILRPFEFGPVFLYTYYINLKKLHDLMSRVTKPQENIFKN